MEKEEWIFGRKHLYVSMYVAESSASREYCLSFDLAYIDVERSSRVIGASFVSKDDFVIQNDHDVGTADTRAYLERTQFYLLALKSVFP